LCKTEKSFKYTIMDIWILGDDLLKELS
jgi:hypothetical protein